MPQLHPCDWLSSSVLVLLLLLNFVVLIHFTPYQFESCSTSGKVEESMGMPQVF
uniref:ATP synthase F0 subunit 8 n=1 Tax=Geomydoecus aurei TaxID=161607 RepID=A0A8F4MC45_9NEOP|nr:ATP synthase F0 subunit 8 [Geomydoecus aurei]